MQSKHVHFVGIKGVGMTPLALIAKQAGWIVTGCDTPEAFITDSVLQQEGIEVSESFSQAHIAGVDLVVATTAHGGLDHPEVIAAKKEGISVVSQGEAVGLFMKGEIFGRSLKGISILGTHGKTTTTALVVSLLTAGELDPSYVIGTSVIGKDGLPGHYGKGDYFVAEADEYRVTTTEGFFTKFLYQYPDIAVITNIEFDHPDVYADIAEVTQAFETFVTNNISSSGILIACGDMQEVRHVVKKSKGKVVTYGEKETNDYILTSYQTQQNQGVFVLKSPDGKEETYVMGVVGMHNALNATAALLVARHSGIAQETVKQGLLAFTGTKRRLEYKGTLGSGMMLFDDYAHHPTEIKKTLHALFEQYPTKKIICVFQPHTYSRTKALFSSFGEAFGQADEVILLPIFSSKRETPDETISSKMLAEAIQHQGKKALFLPTPQDVVQYLSQKQNHGECILITMGAGDVYTIHTLLE